MDKKKPCLTCTYYNWTWKKCRLMDECVDDSVTECGHYEKEEVPPTGCGQG